MAREYDFFAHKRDASLRLVLLAEGEFPSGADGEDWRHLRTRESDDTPAEFRELVASTGYCLFRLGLDIVDIDTA